MRKRFIAIFFATILGFMLSMTIIGCKKADEAPATDEPAAEESADAPAEEAK